MSDHLIAVALRPLLRCPGHDFWSTNHLLKTCQRHRRGEPEDAVSKDESARQKRGSNAPLLLALVLTRPLSFSLRLALAQNVYQLDQRCVPNATATNQTPRLFTFTSMGRSWPNCRGGCVICRADDHEHFHAKSLRLVLTCITLSSL